VRVQARSSVTLMLVLASAAAAQDSVQTDTAARRPSVALFVEASAREVRFNARPVIRVHLLGADFDSVRVLERRNLPDTVQPGVTYRDVYVAVEILGHLNAQCLLGRMGVSAASDSTWHDYCARAGQAPLPDSQPSPPRTP